VGLSAQTFCTPQEARTRALKLVIIQDGGQKH